MTEVPGERPGLREELGIEPPQTLSGWLVALEHRVADLEAITAANAKPLPPFEMLNFVGENWTPEKIAEVKAEWEQRRRDQDSWPVGAPGCPGCSP